MSRWKISVSVEAEDDPKTGCKVSCDSEYSLENLEDTLDQIAHTIWDLHLQRIKNV